MSQNEPVDGEKGNIRHQDGIKTAEYGIRMAKAGNKTANYRIKTAVGWRIPADYRIKTAKAGRLRQQDGELRAFTRPTTARFSGNSCRHPVSRRQNDAQQLEIGLKTAVLCRKFGVSLPKNTGLTPRHALTLFLTIRRKLLISFRKAWD